MLNIRRLLLTLLFSMLAACGGGSTMNDDSNDGGSGGTAVYSLALSLTNADGTASTNLSQSSPLTITATLTATGGGNVANQLISFSLSDTDLAVFGNAAGTALTNQNGVATLSLTAGSKSGAGQVTASYNDGAVTQSVGFSSAGDGGQATDAVIGSITLIADKLQLGTGGTDKVQLYAIIKDTRNVLLSNIPVSFSASALTGDGGDLNVIENTTATDGTAVAELSSRDPSIRQITVSAAAGGLSSSVTISVIGTVVEVSAPTSVVIGDIRQFSLLLKNFDNNSIPYQSLQVQSALGNTLSNSSPETNNVGQATIEYTAVYSGQDTITISGLGITQQFSLNISADSFAFEPLAETEVPLNSSEAVSVKWTRNGYPQTESVTFISTRGGISGSSTVSLNETSVTVIPDVTGTATAYIRSNSAGITTIRASAGSGEDVITTQINVEFIADTPEAVEVQASPSQLGINEQSSVRAIVRDSNNNPVKNAEVNFSLSGAPGGMLSPVSSITNSQGIASTVFTATNTSGRDGVIVTATTGNKSGTTPLTVGERTLFFRFGTGNTVEIPSASLFRKEFSVVVTDASGNPVANQSLNMAVTPVTPKDVAAPLSDEWAYSKGVWVAVPDFDNFEYYAPSVSVSCFNEDVNLNGILDPGEDANNDDELTPGNVAVVEQVTTSDANGIATFNLTYLKNFAGWNNVNITVSGFAEGTENRSSGSFVLTYASSYVNQKDAPPASNPFGVSTNCNDTF